jgi:hypothetical protein
MSKRVVIEVKPEVHKELRKIAVLNDLKIYELTNAILTDYLADDAQIKALLKRLKMVAT